MCPEDDPSIEKDKDEGKTLTTLTNIGLIGGAITAGIGVAWWLFGGSDTEQPPVSASCSPAGCGGAVRGSF